MFGNKNYPAAGPGGKPTLESSLMGLCTIVAMIAALLSMGTIYNYTFEWAYQYFSNSFGDRGLGELAAYAYVGLSTLTVYQICRLVLHIGVTVLASNVLLRFAV